MLKNYKISAEKFGTPDKTHVKGYKMILDYSWIQPTDLVFIDENKRKMFLYKILHFILLFILRVLYSFSFIKF